MFIVQADLQEPGGRGGESWQRQAQKKDTTMSAFLPSAGQSEKRTEKSDVCAYTLIGASSGEAAEEESPWWEKGMRGDCNHIRFCIMYMVLSRLDLTTIDEAPIEESTAQNHRMT